MHPFNSEQRYFRQHRQVLANHSEFMNRLVHYKHKLSHFAPDTCSGWHICHFCKALQGSIATAEGQQSLGFLQNYSCLSPLVYGPTSDGSNIYLTQPALLPQPPAFAREALTVLGRRICRCICKMFHTHRRYPETNEQQSD